MRDFTTFFQRSQLESYQRGVMNYRYRDLPCFKSPLDIAIYMRLLWSARPATLFEIGSKAGGSALLFRDLMRAFELDCRIVSIDLAPPGVAIDGVEFLAGDVLALGDVFERHGLYSCSRPWLAIEDSAHSLAGCTAALRFFAATLHDGEHLVVEDGVLADLGMAGRYGGGPNEAIAEFFRDHPLVFEISTEFCDMFGNNATYNPNGYLRRTSVQLSA